MTVTILIFVAAMISAEVVADSSVDNVYNSCYMDTDDPDRLTKNEMPRSLDLPQWCMVMRHDVAACISRKLHIEDDGSAASRGNVLLTIYERTKNSTILKHVKLYHYGCVYNNWYNFIEDDSCYQTMLSDCVLGSSSCYYVPCEQTKGRTYKTLAKSHELVDSGAIQRNDLIVGILIISMCAA
ncbi:hypothetical protein RB195_000613 [Necator americanus]|uniref:Uncharacterized protein n=1 Tax=Necator americanus TaxID=51031 RepID=A0ABR1DAK2_NECAM